jgi:hypothetical protein
VSGSRIVSNQRRFVDQEWVSVQVPRGIEIAAVRLKIPSHASCGAAGDVGHLGARGRGQRAKDERGATWGDMGTNWVMDFTRMRS